MKTCNNCLTAKTIDHFRTDSRNKDGLVGDCKSCHNEYNKKLPYTKVYNKVKHKLRYRELESGRLKRQFGITLEDKEKIIKSQGDCCAICKTPTNGFKSSPHLDHCHQTGKIRGVLCNSCNRGIGFLKEKVENLESAIRYLNAQNK